MTIITLTTDLGHSSPAAGLLCGVIWTIAPEAKIVELTHEISPRDIRAAQIILENAIPYFPDGTIHLAGAAPFAGEPYRPILARLGTMLFTGPDNGLITPLLERAEANRWKIEIYRANQEQNRVERGRSPLADLAAIAAHLARGMPPLTLGERINDPRRLSLPHPEMLENGWRGEIIQIDHFGNLAVNIKRAHLEGMGSIQVLVVGHGIKGLSKTFGDAQPGELIALIDSSNHLSIGVVNGSAAERLNSHTGDPVEVRIHRKH